MTKEALKLALEALELIGMKNWSLREDKAITAIKEALAQQDSKDKEQAKTDSFVRQLDEALAQPEPWEKFCDSNCVWTDHHPDCKLAQRTWVGLTDGDIAEIYNQKDWDIHTNLDYERAIEAKLKEKNT